jgi:hypothetical protein
MGLPGLDAHPCPEILPECLHFIMVKDLESQVYIPVPASPPSYLPSTTNMPLPPFPSSSTTLIITNFSAPEDHNMTSKCPKNRCPNFFFFFFFLMFAEVVLLL